MAYLRNRSSLMSMQEIALQHILLQLWSIGYIFVDAVAIASQTLISELISKKEKYQQSILQRELISVTTLISIFLAMATFIFLEDFIQLFGSNSFDLFLNTNLIIIINIKHLCLRRNYDCKINTKFKQRFFNLEKNGSRK